MPALRLELRAGIGVAITLHWNPVTGRIWGTAARQVRQLVDEARRRGEVPGHPYPRRYPVSDPLHDRAQMALVLGTCWAVPEPLREDYLALAPDIEAWLLEWPLMEPPAGL